MSTRRASFLFLGVLILATGWSASAAEDAVTAAGRCMTWHKEKSPGLYRQWYDSQHAIHNVTCLDCDRAEAGDADAYERYDALIATLAEALKGGTFSLSFRYRFEAVEDDAPKVRDNIGLASTLRTTLEYEMLPFHGVSFLIEAEDVHDLGFKDEHDNRGAGGLWNGVRDYPVIADPALTEINQGFLRIQPCKRLTIEVGREEVTLDNHRFVGHVGWRQNHQSLDAGDIQWSWEERIALRYLYAGDVNRIFGDSKPMQTHLLNARFGVWQGASVVVYGYFLDYKES
jgi:hypothetical protein